MSDVGRKPTRLDVAHVTTATREVAPGIAAAVAGIAAATSGCPGIDATVVEVLPAGDKPVADPAGVLRARLAIRGPRLVSYAPRLAGWLEGRSPDLVHQHGVWQHPGIATARWCAESRTPLLLSPHGMFGARALATRSLRKRAAWIAYQRAALATVDVVHATSEREWRDVRGLGLRQPVAVVPLGVHAPETCPDRPGHGPLKALYLGRLDPLKGFEDLVQAWARVRPAGWTLDLAGPDDRGAGDSLRRLVARHGLAEVVTVGGPLWDEARDAALDRADLLVLPSYGENFGLVVAEALARGVPVVTTTGTPWRVIAEAGCGWIVPPGIDGTCAGLAAACVRNRGDLREAGRRGWSLVRERFAWPVVGRDLAAVYRWLLGLAPMPSCVRLD